MIPYWAALVVMIAVGRSSDARLERRYHSAVPLMAAALSLILLVTWADQSLPLSILLWCLIAAGIYSVFGPFWSLPAEFLTGSAAAAGIALINCLGNIGGFVGPYAVGAINKTTGSFHGGLVFAAAALLASAFLLLAFRKTGRYPAVSIGSI